MAAAGGLAGGGVLSAEVEDTLLTVAEKSAPTVSAALGSVAEGKRVPIPEEAATVFKSFHSTNLQILRLLTGYVGNINDMHADILGARVSLGMKELYKRWYYTVWPQKYYKGKTLRDGASESVACKEAAKSADAIVAALQEEGADGWYNVVWRQDVDWLSKHDVLPPSVVELELYRVLVDLQREDEADVECARRDAIAEGSDPDEAEDDCPMRVQAVWDFATQGALMLNMSSLLPKSVSSHLYDRVGTMVDKREASLREAMGSLRNAVVMATPEESLALLQELGRVIQVVDPMLVLESVLQVTLLESEAVRDLVLQVGRTYGYVMEHMTLSKVIDLVSKLEDEAAFQMFLKVLEGLASQHKGTAVGTITDAIKDPGALLMALNGWKMSADDAASAAATSMD